MKQTFLLSLLMLLFTNISFAQTPVPATKAAINWITIEEAQELNKKEPRKILVDVYTEWCGPCKMMMKQTFTDPSVIEYINKNFYAVKFNAEGPKPVSFRGKQYTNPNYNPKITRGRNGSHQFASAMRLRGYPTLVIFNEKLQIAKRIVGFKRAPQLLPELKALFQ